MIIVVKTHSNHVVSKTFLQFIFRRFFKFFKKIADPLIKSSDFRKNLEITKHILKKNVKKHLIRAMFICRI